MPHNSQICFSAKTQVGILMLMALIISFSQKQAFVIKCFMINLCICYLGYPPQNIHSWGRGGTASFHNRDCHLLMRWIIVKTSYFSVSRCENIFLWVLKYMHAYTTYCTLVSRSIYLHHINIYVVQCICHILRYTCWAFLLNYIDTGVLLGNILCVKLIRNYVRDPSGLLSISSLEWGYRWLHFLPLHGLKWQASACL